MSKKKLQANIWARFVKDNCDEGTVGGIAVKVQVAPGSKWYDEYLSKEEERSVKCTSSALQKTSNKHDTFPSMTRFCNWLSAHQAHYRKYHI